MCSATLTRASQLGRLRIVQQLPAHSLRRLLSATPPSPYSRSIQATSKLQSCQFILSSRRTLSTTTSNPHPQPPNINDNHGVDAEEISHFNALASTWWSPHGPSRLLHLMNPVRIDFIKSCLRRTGGSAPTEDGLTYLDIGCGGGIFAESAARLPGTSMVTGLDPSADVLAVAKAHAKKDPTLKSKLKYVNASINQLLEDGSTPPQQYDVVSLFEVVEHVPLPAPFLRQCMSLVKPGGWLVGSTISRTWTSWLTTIVAAENVLGIVPPGTHDWNRYINDNELVEFFEGEEGWGNIEKGGYIKIMGVVYVPGIGWKEIKGSEGFGNYFFAARRELEE